MNRVIEFYDPFPEPEAEDDYFLIESDHWDIFAVTAETADNVIRQLEDRVRWLTFRDLSTAWHRILAERVYRISESTADQRAARRAFWRARKLEEKADRRPWEDDDEPLLRPSLVSFTRTRRGSDDGSSAPILFARRHQRRDLRHADVRLSGRDRLLGGPSA